MFAVMHLKRCVWEILLVVNRQHCKLSLRLDVFQSQYIVILFNDIF